MHPLCQVYLAACAELGFRVNRDMNGAARSASALYQITTRERRARVGGHRLSAAGDAARRTCRS